MFLLVDFPVFWPAEKLLHQHSNKSLRRALGILATPLFSIIIWVVVVAGLARSVWKFVTTPLPDGGLSLLFLIENWQMALIAIVALNAAIALIIFYTIFVWKILRLAIRQWKEVRTPETKNYAAMEGFHFGDGVVSISGDGISFRRALYRVFLHWGAISSIVKNGKEVGVKEKSDNPFIFGTAADENTAQLFFDTATEHFTRRQESDAL